VKAPKIIKSISKKLTRLRRRYGLAQGSAPTTLTEARAALRPLGIMLTKKDGEFHVRRRGAGVPAYHTDDLEDAVVTGKTLALEPDLPDEPEDDEGDDELDADGDELLPE
jgi:hypothetical protein